jgi:hypothetical protein
MGKQLCINLLEHNLKWLTTCWYLSSAQLWVKHIMLKRNNLEKHMGKSQTNHDIPSKRLKKNEIYYDKNNKHVQNLTLFSV